MGVNNFYKKGFLIAVYDEEDQLQVVCDNTAEFARVYKKPMHTAKAIISKLASGRQTTFAYNGKYLTIVLIPLDVSEIEELIKGKVTT